MKTFQIFKYTKSDITEKFIEVQKPEVKSNPEVFVCESPGRIFINTVQKLKPYEIPLDVQTIEPNAERCSELFKIVDSVDAIRIKPPSKTRHQIPDSSVFTTVVNKSAYSEFIFIFELFEHTIQYNPHTVHIPEKAPTEKIINYFKWI